MMNEQLKQNVDKIVTEGEQISDRVRKAVEDAAHATKATPDRLAELSQAVIDGAVQAVDRATPDDPESTLRQVVDGLTDGLERSAHATRLAMEEAASEGRAFAEDELRSVAADFKTIGEMFVDTVGRGLSGAAHLTEERARSVRDHAERTFQAIQPSLDKAAHSALHDPIGLAGESAVAAAKLTRDAAGGLLSTVGKLLQSTGDRIRPRSNADAETGDDASSTPSA